MTNLAATFKGLSDLRDTINFDLEFGQELSGNFGPFDIAVWNDSTPGLGDFMVIQIDHADSGKTCFHQGDIQSPTELKRARNKILARIMEAESKIQNYARVKHIFLGYRDDYLAENFYDSFMQWVLGKPMDYPSDAKQFESMSKAELKATADDIDKIVTKLKDSYYDMVDLSEISNKLAIDVRIDFVESDFVDQEEWLDSIDTMSLQTSKKIASM